MTDLNYYCGNCRFHEYWSCICECETSDERGKYKRDEDEACGEWERIDGRYTISDDSGTISVGGK